jgi:hypothetical protein
MCFVGVLWAFGVTGNAQVSQQYTAHIPFDFIVGNKSLKSGDYKVAPLSGTTDQRFFVLVSQIDGSAVLLGQAPIGIAGSNKQGRLVFGNYSDRWVLQEVDTATFQLPVNKRPKETLLAAKGRTETRTVAVGN